MSGDHDPAEEKLLCDVPVYLSKQLAKKLYIVQYPQRPSTVPIKESEILESKMKPTLDKIQLTLGLDTESDYYDEFHGELLAEAAEGLGLNEDEYIPDTRKKIDKTVLESTCHPKLTNPARYVFGIIKNGAVHLTPLKSIIQMKPTLPFLNKADKARAKHENAISGGAAGVDTEDSGDEEAQKVTVKFKRNPLDPNKPSSTTKSSFTARKKEEEEHWLSLDYSDATNATFNQLFTPNTENDDPMYVLTQKDYLQRLFPRHIETVIDGSDKTTIKSSTSSSSVPQKINVQNMKEMSLQDQLKVLIINGKVMQYDQILEFLRQRLRVNVDDTTLLRTVQTVAVLVQGCWVARSEILYPDDYKSNDNGVAGPIMQAARDTVLSFYTEQRFVERRKLLPILHLPNEELTEILSSCGTRVVKKGWEFLLPYDHSFISRYPDVVQRQSMIWDVKNQHRKRKVSESAKEAASQQLRPPPRSPPRRRHSRTMSYSSDNESGTESSEGQQRGRRGSGGGGGGAGSSGRQRRNSARSGSEASLLGVPSKVES